MSTDYRLLKNVLFIEVFDGRLEKYGISEKVRADTTESRRYLVGRDGVLLVYREEDGTPSFTRPSFRPVPWSVYDALVEEFDTELVSEHDPRYWGFATEEEWDAAWAELARKSENEFYEDLLHYVRNEPHDLRAGTIGATKAEIAKTLVTREPSLMASENRGALLAAVEEYYEQKHVVKVTLTDGEIAAAEMLVTRTDKLPRA